MAELTAAQVALLRDEVGAEPSTADLQARWDRLGDLTQVAMSVHRGRLQDLLASPASLSVPGVISQDVSTNIRALQERLQVLAKDGLGGDSVPVSPLLTVSRPRPRSPRR